jgi:hypothetical protein
MNKTKRLSEKRGSEQYLTTGKSHLPSTMGWFGWNEVDLS